MKILTIFFGLFFIWQIGATAPAYQGDIEFKNSDGSVFIGKLKGDEWFSWIEDKNGKIIKYNSISKNYEHGKFVDIDGKNQLIPNGVKVGDEPMQTPDTAKTIINKKIVVEKNKLKKLHDIWQRKRLQALGHKSHDSQQQPVKRKH